MTVLRNAKFTFLLAMKVSKVRQDSYIYIYRRLNILVEK